MRNASPLRWEESQNDSQSPRPSAREEVRRPTCGTPLRIALLGLVFEESCHVVEVGVTCEGLGWTDHGDAAVAMGGFAWGAVLEGEATEGGGQRWNPEMVAVGNTCLSRASAPVLPAVLTDAPVCQVSLGRLQSCSKYFLLDDRREVFKCRCS